MKITLLHSPIDDPTMPYHATAYLKGYLAHEGFPDVDTRDINVEFVDYCLQPANIGHFYSEIDRRIEALTLQDSLTADEQLQYFQLLGLKRPDPAELCEAVRVMRDPEAFADWPRYRSSVELINRFFGCLGSLAYPASIHDFRLTSRGNFSTESAADLFNRELSDRICLPIKHYFDTALRFDEGLLASDIIGISIVYDHQMFPAIWLARAIRETWPDKLILLGGTGISQYYKYLRDKQKMKDFFDVCDAIVVGEGESAIAEIARANGDRELIRRAKNTITYDRALDFLTLPGGIHYEDVRQLPPPIYSSPWDLYLSPNRGINYSPTRGCYWNRCTFCDYGLNTDSPTSPWRERKIDQVIEDLRQSIDSNQIGYVYFAVDVMAPGYLERLSDKILESNLQIKWSAELRMEKIFTPERCRKMKQAGCVCVSFGMESGNQRVLDLIDKGTKVQYMAETMKNFSEAGIAVQLMTFHGFPTETPEEKAATMRFVRDNDDYWATGGFGEFLLTRNAIIAKEPAKFGIELVQIQGSDAPRAYRFEIQQPAMGCGGGVGPAPGRRLTEEIDASFHESGNLFAKTLGRPWAGGTDSLHSMIYYQRFGRKFFREHPLHAAEAADPIAKTNGPAPLDGQFLRLLGNYADVPFDLTRVVKLNRMLHYFIAGTLDENREPTWQAAQEFHRSVPRLFREQTSSWILSTKSCMRIDDHARRMLNESEDKHEPVGRVIKREPFDQQLRLEVYLSRMRKAGLVELNSAPDSEAVLA